MNKKDKIKYTSYFLAMQIFIGSYIMCLNYILDKFNDKSYSNETLSYNNNIKDLNYKNNEMNNITEETIYSKNITEPTIIDSELENNQCNKDEIIIDNNKGTIINNTSLYKNSNNNSLIISNLNINDSCIRLLKDNNYDLVKTNNLIGYVESNNIVYDEYIPDNIKIIKDNDIVITTTNLNFRQDSNTFSNIILTLDKNIELEVIGKTNDDWLLVKYNDIIGFVKEDYTISLKEQINLKYPNLNIKDLNFKKIVYATCNLNIREKNSTSSNVLNTLENYESLRVIDEKEDWYLIMTNEYQFGYVNKNYTKDLTDTFIIVDLSKQDLYLYNNENLYYQTKVTTGKDSTPSDKGLFKIHYKDNYCYITDTAFVDYWLNYNSSNEGIHDASWRKIYGEEDYHYNGSHGCINTPHEIMGKIYEKANIGTKVLVHK